MADRITIRNLRLNVYLGVYPEELLARRQVSAEITVHVDLAKACVSDLLVDTVDYHALALAISRAVSGEKHFALVESLAGTIAASALAFDMRVKSVDVRVAKAACVPNSDCAEIEISRNRGEEKDEC